MSLGIALQAVLPGEQVVVPGRDDAGLAGGKSRLAGVDRYEQALGVEVLEEGEAGVRRLGRIAARRRKTCRPDALDGAVVLARIAGQGEQRAAVLVEISPALGATAGDEVVVDHERQHTVVAGNPVAIRILGLCRDLVERCDLIWLYELLLDRLRTETEADVDDIGGLRAGVALVRLDGFEFVGRAAFFIDRVEGDARILLHEGIFGAAVIAPVTRRRDDGDAAFFLGCVVERRQIGRRECRDGGAQQGHQRHRSGEDGFHVHARLPWEIGCSCSRGGGWESRGSPSGDK